jgi:hypothetical protein
MNQLQTSDTGKTDATDDPCNAPQYDESVQLADGGRREAVARLRERFLFS